MSMEMRIETLHRAIKSNEDGIGIEMLKDFYRDCKLEGSVERLEERKKERSRDYRHAQSMQESE